MVRKWNERCWARNGIWDNSIEVHTAKEKWTYNKRPNKVGADTVVKVYYVWSKQSLPRTHTCN